MVVVFVVIAGIGRKIFLCAQLGKLWRRQQGRLDLRTGFRPFNQTANQFAIALVFRNISASDFMVTDHERSA